MEIVGDREFPTPITMDVYSFRAFSETEVLSSTAHGVHEHLMLALDWTDLIGGYVIRIELPQNPLLLRQAIIVARLLDSYLDGINNGSVTVFVKFASVRAPQFSVPFNGEQWPSYHFAAAKLCREVLWIYEQVAHEFSGALGRLSLEDAVVKANENWPEFARITNASERPPLFVSNKWPLKELKTACEVEFDKLKVLIDHEASARVTSGNNLSGEAVGQHESGGNSDMLTRTSETVEVPPLSEKQYMIIETMIEMGAVSADTRQNAQAISIACDGPLADVNVFKPLLADLTKRKLTESKTGSGGGSWLTLQGISVAKSLLKNRKSSASQRQN